MANLKTKQRQHLGIKSFFHKIEGMFKSTFKLQHEDSLANNVCSCGGVLDAEGSVSRSYAVLSCLGATLIKMAYCTEFEGNPCSGLREVDNNDDDNNKEL